jgi:hypothetical protein
MNFQATFREGREGRNVGRTTGIPPLDRAMGGIQKRKIYVIAAAPKVGKSKLVNSAFVIEPYEQALNDGTIDDLDWIYFSFEMDRVSVEFEFTAYYMAREFRLFNFVYQGKTLSISSEYLQGKLIGPDGKFVKVLEEHTNTIIQIYEKRIIPLFGEFSEDGKQLSRGKITFITQKENPTGLRNYLIGIAKSEGTFLTEIYSTLDEKGKKVNRERTTGFQSNKPDHMWIIVTDTMRKVKGERGFDKKQTVDKWSEYQCELRDWGCGFTFVDIIHTNRGQSSIERLKFAGEFIYPTGDDLKDTGNLSEDANVVLTMFNPHDEKYGLEKHFGLDLISYPNYRSIHLVESRGTVCPAHIQVNMYGASGLFVAI